MRQPLVLIIACCSALGFLPRCAPVHDATPASCPAGQEANGALCVCVSTQAPPVDGSCSPTTTGDGGTACSVDDCEDDGNPCTEPTCVTDASTCSNEPVADQTSCGSGGFAGSCMSGECITTTTEWELRKAFRIGGEGGEIARPLVAADADGNGVAVWAEADVLMACHFESGEGWGTPVVIEELFDPERVFSLDSDAEGNAIVVYARTERGSIDIHAIRYDSVLGIWTTPDVISRAGAVASDARIAITSDGTAVASWWEAPGTVLLSRTESNRLTWDAPVVVSPSDELEKAGPYISLADNGYGAIIYRGRGSTGVWDTVWVNALTADESFGSPVAVRESSSEVVSVRIAAADDGELMAVWEEGNDVWHARFVGGEWHASDVLEIGSGSAFSPVVASAGPGVFLAVWAQARSMRARRFTMESGWGDTATFGQGFSTTARRPHLTASASGDAWLVWLEDDSIWLRAFAPESSWGTIEEIGPDLTPDAPDSQTPCLARSENATLIVVWGDAQSVWAWTDVR